MFNGIEAILPNIIVLLADDLGIGDVGCYGNMSIQTPNIDRLCSDGVKLEHHLAAAPLCTPSRASFLTGRYAMRCGLDTSGPDMPRVIVYLSGQAGLSEDETTWASILQTEGYNTAAFGKWHLGWDGDSKGDNQHGPSTHGFQSFFGLPFTLVDGFEEENEDMFLSMSNVDANSSLAIAFIFLVTFVYMLRKVRSTRTYSFWNLFCFSAFSVSISLIILLTLQHFKLHDSSCWWQRSRYMEKKLNSVLMNNTSILEHPIQLKDLTQRLGEEAVRFVNSVQEPFLVYFAFPNVHTPLVEGERCSGIKKPNLHGAYGCSLFEMDAVIGDIMRAVKERNIENETLVYFTSDQGSHIDIGKDGGSNLPFKGGKSMAIHEGGIRVPGILKWPRKIKANTSFLLPTSHLDWTPTLISLIGVRRQKTTNIQFDGIDLSKSTLFRSDNGDDELICNRIFRHYCGSKIHGLRLLRKKMGHNVEIYKAYKCHPILNEDGHCGTGVLCPCYSSHSVKCYNVSDMPIYDLVSDPLETEPLPLNTSIRLHILEHFQSEIDKIGDENVMESQFARMGNVLPRPWIQPF